MRKIEPLLPGGIYHIYNCGNNGESLFKEERNYYYFLKKYQQYCTKILETYAFVLMNNHFHLLIKVNEHVRVTGKDGKTETELNASRQLSHFLNSYAQSINKAYQRSGKLFEEPFKRKMVKKSSYFTRLIHYIHLNPEYHGFVTDFRHWEFSSWHLLMHERSSFVAKQKVFDWFGSKIQFEHYHTYKPEDDGSIEMFLD
jgi:REP element-mobilizing transposase RayT